MVAENQPGHIDQIKQTNAGAVYRLIDQLGPVSRIDLSRLAQLAPASITKIVREMLEAHLVQELEIKEAGNRGRPAVGLVVETEAWHYLSLRISRGEIFLALRDLSSKLVVEEAQELALKDDSPLLDRIISHIDQFFIRHQKKLERLTSIAITLPGIIDTENGIVHRMPFYEDVKEMPLGEALEQHTGVPVYIQHDISAWTMAEALFGASRGARDVIQVVIDHNVGAGVITDGHLLHAGSSSLVEIGHTQVDPYGKRCYCGNHGCLETIASVDSILELAQLRLNQSMSSMLHGQPLTVDSLCQAALRGDLLAKDIITGVGAHVGRILAIDVPKPWNDPMANNPLTTLNLLEHDDSHVGVQLVKAQTVIGSGGSLTLRDLQGDEVEADKTLHIAQNGTVVAEGDYGFRLTTAPGDGLYVNYGLKALNIHGGQKLTLAEHGGAYGATADMSAKIGGEGDLAINTVRQVSLSNGQNDYQGATYVQMGTLRTDADGALGNTRELNISNAAIVDLNGSTQTVETFTGQMGSTVLFKEGSLTVNKGGISQGELTGGGNLNVTGGTLAIEGLNARYNALTSISPNAEVSLDNTQGLGRGNIANDGLLTLKNVTGELRNSISGKGIVSATARTDVELDGDNSRFVGQFNIDTGSALSVNEQKNLGDASVINNGLLTISTERSWAMTHSISGSILLLWIRKAHQFIARRPEAISATLPQPTRCLAIVYTTVWVSRSIQIHCILRVRQAVCGCVMSEGTNVQGPVTVS